MSSLFSNSRPQLTEQQLLRWQKLLEARAGICFAKHHSIIRKGVVERMRELNIDDYEAYYNQIESTPLATVEWHKLLDHIVVKETSFFRDSYSYQLAEQFLKQQVESIGRTQSDSIDIWSVGCSTGEEAYSLAMLADNIIDASNKEIYLGVIGLDISEDALIKARAGIYKQQALLKTPKFLLEKYFEQTGDSHFLKAKKTLTEKLCFTRGNIMDLATAPKMKMDIIFCQNVLIYFRRERQLEVMDKLIKRLKPNGLLVIGTGEIGTFQHPDVTRSTAANVQAYIKK